jgi:hypothetical protein
MFCQYKKAGHVARMEQMKNLYKILVGKSEGKSRLKKKPSPNCMLQGHSKIVQRCNSRAQASKDSPELVA